MFLLPHSTQLNRSIPRTFQILFPNHLWIQASGAPWNKCRTDYHRRQNGELDTSDITDARGDIFVVGFGDVVDVAAEQGRGGGVHDNVGAVEEGHDGAEGGYVGVCGFFALEERLDVGC